VKIRKYGRTRKQTARKPTIKKVTARGKQTRIRRHRRMCESGRRSGAPCTRRGKPFAYRHKIGINHTLGGLQASYEDMRQFQEFITDSKEEIWSVWQTHMLYGSKQFNFFRDDPSVLNLEELLVKSFANGFVDRNQNGRLEQWLYNNIDWSFFVNRMSGVSTDQKNLKQIYVVRPRSERNIKNRLFNRGDQKLLLKVRNKRFSYSSDSNTRSPTILGHKIVFPLLTRQEQWIHHQDLVW
jgi:hypothetical protein